MEINWQFVRAGIAAKVTKRPCPACGHDAWGGGTALVLSEVLEYEQANGYRMILGRNVPLVRVPLPQDLKHHSPRSGVTGHHCRSAAARSSATLNDGRPYVVHVPINCDRCGYTEFYDVVRLLEGVAD
jgi:ribosomal protein S27AE